MHRADRLHSDVVFACWDLALTRAPHGLIKGRVQRSDGSPVAHLQVALIDSEGFNTATTDEQGYFQFDSLRPGEYRVGINRPGAPEWKIGSCGGAGCQPQPASLYYSGTRNPSDANVIFLHTDEKRDDINFVVTPQ